MDDVTGSVRGRVALVTGASRGIGRALARRLAAEGAAVVLSASRLGRHGPLAGTLEEARDEILGEGGAAAVEIADLADPEARADLVTRAEAHFGPLDVLVNNAAMARWGLPSELALSDRRKLFEVNVQAPVDLIQHVLPGMRARRRGWILNISSDSARQPLPPFVDTPEAAHVIAGYGASKAALERYTEGLAHEVAGDRVRVNALSPVAIVLTQEAARFVGPLAIRRPDLVEPIELMVEAALALVSGDDFGRVVHSRPHLAAIGRAVRSLDGKQILGDATLPADLGATVA
jgi:NAD(P)-dependent dehydrogenase (short-subunit alcohol dehydrogenase family)